MLGKRIFIISFALASAQSAENHTTNLCPSGDKILFQEIFWRQGVPVDYGYNETTYNNDKGMSSTPGCPKSLEGVPWVTFELCNSSSPNSNICCYLSGSRGPCPRGQLFYAQSGSAFGICSCNCLYLHREVDSGDTQRFQACDGTSGLQIYDKMDKSVCYNGGEQGPCPNGTVVASRPTGAWVCLPFCDKDDMYATEKSKKEKCVLNYITNNGYLATSVPTHECGGGGRYISVLKKCTTTRSKPFIL